MYVRLLRGLGGCAWPAALGMTLFVSVIVVLPALWLLLLRADVRQFADHLTAELAVGRLRPLAFVDDLPVVRPDIAAWLNAVLAEPARLKMEVRALFGRLDLEALALLVDVGGLVKLVFARLTLFLVHLGGQSLAVQVGLGYWVAGLPAPVTLTAVTVLLALIPFGTPLAWGH